MDLFDKTRSDQNRLAGRGRTKESYVCAGCHYLIENRRGFKWGGRCGPDDESCRFFITKEQYLKKLKYMREYADNQTRRKENSGT